MVVLKNYYLCLLAVASSIVRSAPSPLPGGNTVEERQLNLDGLTGVLNNINHAAQTAADPFAAMLKILKGIKPAKKPESIEEVKSMLSSAKSKKNPRGYFEQSAALISNGLASNDLEGIIAGFTTENNPVNLLNPVLPAAKAVYPKKQAGDAPYSLTEQQLRQQIFIPSDFTYGDKPPVILIPGTGERGGNTYSGNMRKLLRDNPNADPVLLNYPGYGLDDAQVNAETVAYSMNYISALTNRNVSAIAWSQGNLNVQWVRVCVTPIFHILITTCLVTQILAINPRRRPELHRLQPRLSWHP